MLRDMVAQNRVRSVVYLNIFTARSLGKVTSSESILEGEDGRYPIEDEEALTSSTAPCNEKVVGGQVGL